MKYKIEKKLVQNGRNAGDFADFVRALKELNVGESFLSEVASVSNRRMAISIVQILLDRRFATHTEDGGVRIGRII